MESARNKELIRAHLPPSKSSRWAHAHTHTQRCDEVRLVGFGVRSQRKKEVLAAFLKEEEKNTGNEKREKTVDLLIQIGRDRVRRSESR